ncbi:uncharacterized protein LOC134841338 [Symsagittifera roscoffensis]|uniref:uncharacterized protein LOC134841338 n=1 Tax=Symsagittifera roscoffensis TaxID=84072 RepID=UPI00307BD098
MRVCSWSEQFYLSTGSQWNSQESSLTYRMGRVSVLDLKDHMGVYHHQNEISFSPSSRARTVQLLVFVQVQDEVDFTPGQQFSLIYSLESGGAVATNQHNFQVDFLPERRPMVDLEVEVAYTLDREFVPGDTIQFTAKMSHQCESSAQATNIHTILHLPDVVLRMDNNITHYTGQLPVLDYTAGDKKAAFTLDKLGTSEYTEFRFDIEVTSASLAVRESRDYFATCPVDIHYTRNAREGDEDDADQVYQQKSTSAEARFLVTNDSCAGSRVPISDTTLFQECQITSSSELDPLEYSVHRGLSAQLSQGWRSNSWQGQWQSRQYIKLALLRSYKISKVVFHKDSSFGSFELHYSNDPEGIYWTQYEEQSTVRQFYSNQSFEDIDNSLLRYLDIRQPLDASWVRLVFTSASEDPQDSLGVQNILAFRFDLLGCPNNFGGVVDITRVCRVGASIPHVYDRGFLIDTTLKVLFVCEKNLQIDANECMRMVTLADGSTAWSKVNHRVHSVIGYWISQQTVFAVSQSQSTYLASDDGGLTWLTVQTREFWDAQDMTSDYYKPAVSIPPEFYPTPLDQVSSDMTDEWEGTKFYANHEGIWSNVGLEGTWNETELVYSWSLCCA